MERRLRGHLLLFAVLTIAFSSYIIQVASVPVGTINEWPTFPRRNIAALARAGYLKSASLGYKRSISTLAKNGQLPTFSSPYTGLDGNKPEHEDEESSQEKRNMASIARLRSYSAMKRNIQALARDGYRVGRGQYNDQNEKRNVAALARNGMFGKRDDEANGDEYYYPIYQNLPPLSEINGPFDFNEWKDFQQSVDPDMLSPSTQMYKRSAFARFPDTNDGAFANWSYKRSSMGMPVHGLYRPNYVDPTVRTKRYIMSMPDELEGNEIEEAEENDKRSVGSIPMTRISELGNISLVPKLAKQSIQTTPTYRRRQYLLTRTQQGGSSTDR